VTLNVTEISVVKSRPSVPHEANLLLLCWLVAKSSGRCNVMVWPYSVRLSACPFLRFFSNLNIVCGSFLYFNGVHGAYTM